MSDATCKTCPWCDTEKHDKRDRLTDFAPCRVNAPTIAAFEAEVNMLAYADWPWVHMSEDWCGSHPDRQPHLECGMTTLVGRETFPTEGDMRRIVDALEKMARRAQWVKP